MVAGWCIRLSIKGVGGAELGIVGRQIICTHMSMSSKWIRPCISYTSRTIRHACRNSPNAVSKWSKIELEGSRSAFFLHEHFKMLAS
jgi:hypothetical protein